MSEFWHDFIQKDADVELPVLAKRLAAAFVLGCVAAGIYRWTHGKRGQSTGLTATLVLLTVLIAMVTLVIGNNVARAFSLVGALAIVRFRTVVEDTRDTAFVIFAVAVGMAVGAGFPMVPLVGIPFVALAAFLFRPRETALAADSATFTLTVRVGAGHDPDGLLRETFGKHLESSLLLATATARQGAAIDLTYRVGLRRPDAALALVAELNALEGVQSVELRRA
jgi:uncharacterized membrane protein YhiD involved in acid resistance